MENAGKIKSTAGQTGETQPEMFTKDKVNELMKKRVERSHKSFFNRYGVKDLNELDGLFGKAKSVEKLKKNIEELTKTKDDMQKQYDELENQYKGLSKKYAFTSKNIRPDKYSDIETYFKGKELEINENTLAEELKSHTDWVNKTGSIVPMGNEQTKTGGMSEKELASKYLGVDL